jgi:drug/metabolite transporter (DMT)-like permease
VVKAKEVSAMGYGIALCFLGALSFGLLGTASKAAERRNCNASVLIASLFGWAAGFIWLRTLALGKAFLVQPRVVWTAIPFGICAAVAFLAFQRSIAIGKVTVGWLVMNLSAGVPALVSIWLYRERLTLLKCGAFALALASLWCLFRGVGTADSQLEQAADDGRRRAGTWALLMLVILATNGMSAFGLKVIAAWGLSKAFTFPYLTVWYGVGFLCLLISIFFHRVTARAEDLAWGAGMALLSIAGQVAMGMSLGAGVPGNIVFPVTIGGSILVVALTGKWVFHETMNRLSTVGVIVGFLAVVLLSVS